MLFDISLGQDAYSMSTFQYFLNWFRSLYDIEWNFFGESITLFQCLMCVGLTMVVLDAFRKSFGLVTGQEESDAVIAKLEARLRGW